MTSWNRGVPEPFASNSDFWRSIGASVDALLGIVLAAALTIWLGPIGAIAFLVPAALLLRAAVTGRRSEHQTRTTFSSPDEWRQAERRAVARVLPSAVIRPRRLAGGPR